MRTLLVLALILIADPALAQQPWPFAPPAPAHNKAQLKQAEWKDRLLAEARAYCRAYPHDWHCNFLPR